MAAPSSGSWDRVHTHSSVSYSSIQRVGCVVVKLPRNLFFRAFILRFSIFSDLGVVEHISWIALVISEG